MRVQVSTMPLAAHFYSRDGYTFLSHDAPDWLRAAVHAAYAGNSPCCWVRDMCELFCQAIDEGDIAESEDEDGYAGSIHEWCLGTVELEEPDEKEAPPELVKWYADHKPFPNDGDISREDIGYPDTPAGRMRTAQYLALRFIAYRILWPMP